MFTTHLKTAWRNTLYHRTSSLINLAGLTIGMTSAFLIFMWVQNEYSYDMYHPDAENIFRLTKTEKDGMDERIPYKLSEEFKQQVPEIKMLARIFPLSVFQPNISVDKKLFKEKKAAYVDENWFKLFEFDFVEGSSWNFNKIHNSVVISEANAKRYFGNESAAGKTVNINGTECIVQGVIKDFRSNSSFRYDLFISDAVRVVNQRQRDFLSPADSYQTYIKILPESSPTTVLNKINLIPNEDWKASYSIDLITLKDLHFENLRHSFLEHGDKKITNILFLLGVLLLAIACVNYVNLTTAKASVRIKEVSIKKIIGAGKQQLFFQFIAESAMISGLALIATVVLVWASLPLFNRFTDNNFVISITDPALWKLLILTSLGTLVLVSIYPAIVLSSFKPLSGLKNSNTQTSADGMLRKTLVVAQFAISIALVVGTIVIYKQMQFINEKYENLDKSQLFSFMFYSSLEGEGKKLQMESVRQQLLSHSSIENVSIMSGKNAINMANSWAGFDWDGRDKNIENAIDYILVGSNYNELTNLNLIAGRWFKHGSKNDEKNFILNETAVKELGIRTPVIGQRLSLDADTGKIIGVVEDFHYTKVHARIGALVLGNDLSNANSFFVKTVPGKQEEALAFTTGVLKKYTPGDPFDYQFASDEFNVLYNKDQKSASLIWSFSVLAIFISCLGLYGLATFSAERRNKEIGIRKVLGASVPGIVTMLSGDFLKLVVIALFVAFPISWWAMNKWLLNFAYRIEIQWWMFIMAAGIGIVIAFVTISFQAVKAALANPVKSLRSE